MLTIKTHKQKNPLKLLTPKGYPKIVLYANYEKNL